MYKDIIDTIGYVEKVDPELGAAMGRELGRQRQNIELIASENIVSPAVMAAMGSVLTNKYAEGYPGNRYYGGCQYVDHGRANRHRPRLQAVRRQVRQCAAPLRRTGQPGRLLCAAEAGRYRHGHEPVPRRPSDPRLPGEHVRQDTTTLSPTAWTRTACIDYDAAAPSRLTKVQPQADRGRRVAPIPRAIDFEKLRAIANEVRRHADGGYGPHCRSGGGRRCIQSPVPYADVVTTTTHKTLRGPRGGLILYERRVPDQARSTRPSSPARRAARWMHVIAAKAVCFGEALKPEFKEYQPQDRRERQGAWPMSLTARGVKLVSGGTDNHLLLIDLTRQGLHRQGAGAQSGRGAHHRQQEHRPR